MKIRPLNERVVAKRLEETEEKIGSIVVPDTAKEKPLTAKIVAVGSGKLLDDGSRQPLELKKGQTILVGKYAGSDVEIGDEKFVVLREDDVLGIVE